jgi:hypothetical protein
MDERVQEILDNATDIQHEYVIARLTHRDPAKAARALGLNRSTPHNWDNLGELEEAVRLLRRDAIEAARLALRGLAMDAVVAVGQVLRNKHSSDAATVSAAKAVWDRIGLPAQSAVDVTSGGEPLKVQFTWHDPTDTDPNAKAAQPDTEADDHL